MNLEHSVRGHTVDRAPEVATCDGPDCERPRARGPYCWGHAKQLARGQRLHPLRKRAYDKLAATLDAFWSLVLVDEYDDDAFRRGEVRVRSAIRKYAESLARKS